MSPLIIKRHYHDGLQNNTGRRRNINHRGAKTVGRQVTMTQEEWEAIRILVGERVTKSNVSYSGACAVLGRAVLQDKSKFNFLNHEILTKR